MYLATITNQTDKNNIEKSNIEYEEERRQLQENHATITIKCAQLDEANRAWQLFQQAQLDNFRDKLQNSLPIEDNFSFDQIAQFIVGHLNQITNDRDNLLQQLQASEKLNNDLRSGKTLLSLSSDNYFTSFSCLRINQ